MQMDFFSRLIPLYGKESLDKLSKVKVILFGVGGVGSWCAEALIRSGIKHLVLVDPDFVVASNVNRQLPATKETLGLAKVEVLAKRLTEIVPDVIIEPRIEIYNPGDAKKFSLESFDVVIDAIDSMQAKVDLILSSTEKQVLLFSSLGAAGRTDPTFVRHSDIWKSVGCPLGKQLRQILRKKGFSGNFEVVYSLENPKTGYCDISKKGSKPALGSVVTVTATFGLTLASLILNTLLLSQNENL